jgi:nitroreductase
MEFADLISYRRSIRAYTPDPVQDDKLARILEAARLAPTACNRQPFRIVVVRTRGRERDLRRVYDHQWFVQAPLVLCACGIPGDAWRRRDGKNYDDVDVTIALDHLILAATNEGLGTCWIAAFDPAAAREVLALPGNVEPIAFTPLGHPAERPRGPARKPLRDLVFYEQWGTRLPPG